MFSYINVRQIPWEIEMFKTLDDRAGLVLIEAHLISQVYMNEVLRSVVLPLCAKTSGSTRPKMTMPELTSLESAKTMLFALTRQYAHQTCLQF